MTVWSNKKTPRLARNSLKNFKFDGNKILKQECVKPQSSLAVIYCRVSSDRQVREWFWLETQEKIAREYCRTHHIEVDRVFKEEWVSWKEQHRKAFDECVNYIAEKNSKFIVVTHFVCRDLTRISRPDLDNIWVAFDMEERIKSYWVEIVDIEWNTKDDTDEWKLTKAISYAFAWYQRKKIEKLCLTGRKWRLLQWYRPFTYVPMWYVREKHWKNYVDKIDWSTAGILKEWLELFANDPNMGQIDLFNFLISKWLKSPKWKKIRKTYVEKMLQLHRLYFYAWYCIYPERDVNELVEWQHEWIISLDTANKIRNKIQTKKPKIKREKVDDKFLLKHLITCKWCWRKLTWWTTVKKNTGKWYWYYWCQLEWCKERDHIPQQKLEDEVFNMIKSIQFPESLLKLFEATLNSVWWLKEKDWDKIIEEKKKRLKQIPIEKAKIEKLLLDDKINDALKEKMDNNRFLLDEEEKQINEEILDNDLIKIDRNKKLKKIKELISNPLAFWEYWDIWLKKQLLEVRFWDSLVYSKSEWLQTIQDAVLYNVLRDLVHKSTLFYPERDLNPHGLAATRFWV